MFESQRDVHGNSTFDIRYSIFSFVHWNWFPPVTHVGCRQLKQSVFTGASANNLFLIKNCSCNSDDCVSNIQHKFGQKQRKREREREREREGGREGGRERTRRERIDGRLELTLKRFSCLAPQSGVTVLNQSIVPVPQLALS